MKVNLVTAWSWLEKELEERDLTSTEQLTLFHLLLKLNRNFWKPARISINKLSVSMAKDKRTVVKALEKLIEYGLVTKNDEGSYYIGIGREHNKEVEKSPAQVGRNLEQDRISVDGGTELEERFG